jgi:hypothetical protein
MVVLELFPTTIALAVMKSVPITAEPELCPMRKNARYVIIVEHQFNLITDQLLQPLSRDWPSEHQAALMPSQGFLLRVL